MSSSRGVVPWLALALCAASCDTSAVYLGNDLHAAQRDASDGTGTHTMSGKDSGTTSDTGAGAGSGGSNGSGGMSPPGRRDAGTTTDAGTTDAGAVATGCPAGFADCDGSTSNGCEVDINTTTAHCGSCANACPPFGFMSFGSSCMAGHCVLVCESPHADCDAMPGNGCEADLVFSDDSCGACGVHCSCNAGQCR